MQINPTSYKIYCDMDGVLTDFKGDFQHYSGYSTEEYETKFGEKAFWKFIHHDIGIKFWSDMNWMPSGKELWKYIESYSPILLSAPFNHPDSRKGKKIWVESNIGKQKLILSKAINKKNYASTKSILIDDMEKNIKGWISKGGIGILHSSNDDTIKQLKKLGL